ncbi:hypothetical protein BT93_C2255 [Corymbia citriodora subsp. variegata]|nr:hypothetical protein BT93_C2255 [Corymbia citriodora subsp. variegata]
MSRLGIVVDFWSHSNIVVFVSGAAITMCVQQLKGIFGLTPFTIKTDAMSTLCAVFKNRDKVRDIST